MLQFETLRNYKNPNKLVKLWNREFNGKYPITPLLFRKRVLDDANLNKDASFVALYDNAPVGFIFIKTWLADTGLYREDDVAYISLMFVKKEMRNMHIGSDLLNLAISEIKKHQSIKKIVVGDDVNNLFAGVPNELTLSPIFFMNKGFVQKGSLVDMISIVKKTSFDDNLPENIQFRVATFDDKPSLLKFCVSNGYGKNAYLINQYYSRGGTGRRIVIATIEDKIVGMAKIYEEDKIPLVRFASIKEKNIGRIVLVGLDKEYDNDELLVSLNKACVNYLVLRGSKKIVATDVSDIQFYKRLGFSAFKYYLQFEMVI